MKDPENDFIEKQEKKIEELIKKNIGENIGEHVKRYLNDDERILNTAARKELGKYLKAWLVPFGALGIIITAFINGCVSTNQEKAYSDALNQAQNKLYESLIGNNKSFNELRDDQLKQQSDFQIEIEKNKNQLSNINKEFEKLLNKKLREADEKLRKLDEIKEKDIAEISERLGKSYNYIIRHNIEIREMLRKQIKELIETNKDVNQKIIIEEIADKIYKKYKKEINKEINEKINEKIKNHEH